MNRYDSYKDSGVAWLGEVPSHWEIKKMKYLFRDVSIKNKPNETLLSVTQDRGVIPRNWIDGRVVMPSGNLDTFKFIEKGDFAISLRSFEGGLEFCHHNGIISPAYTVLKYNKNHLIDLYYKFLFKSKKFISELQISVVGIREGKNISYEELQYSYLPIPPLSEQTAIAQYLDNKTAKIDRAIELEQQQIELLKERKQIVIQTAVTRGLNPDVALKDSGVEWLGKVPEHWEVKKLKYLGNAIIGLTYSPDDLCDESEGILVARSSNIQNGQFVYSDNVYVKKQVSEKLKLKKHDILICSRNGSRDLIGKCAYITEQQEKHTFGAFTTVFRSKYNSYLFYILNSEIFKALSGSFLTSTINQLTISNLNSIQIALPPLSEQTAIVQYLDEQTAKIDHAINIKLAQIEKLKEYKTVLINEVVTGKRWVVQN